MLKGAPGASSRAGASQSPTSNTRPKLSQNGSAVPSHAVIHDPQKMKLRVDLRAMDPDEIFAKHTVHEVKTILLRLRYEIVC